MFNFENVCTYRTAVVINQFVDKLYRCNPLDAVHVCKCGKGILLGETSSGIYSIIAGNRYFTAKMTAIMAVLKFKSQLSSVCGMGPNFMKLIIVTFTWLHSTIDCQDYYYGNGHVI
jgi:hypothetical protein